MLSELSVSHFALIENLKVEFDQGLNIVTGTTGVGKSLIIGALNFLLGSRASNEIIMTNRKEACVSGIFLIKNREILKAVQKHTDNTEDGIILQRRLDQNGRNRCTLNNHPITVSLLREMGELLVNIHGQQEHETLTNPANQLVILDSFGKSDTQRMQFSELYSRALKKEREISRLTERREERKKQISLYRFEIEEIENADLKPDELNSLEQERRILVNSEKIRGTISSCLNALCESDDTIVERLREITNELTRIRDIDKGFDNSLEACSQSVYQLEDVAHSLRIASEKYESDPEQLRVIEDRIGLIRRLESKYGGSIEEILSYGEESKRKLEVLLRENEDLAGMEEEIQALRKAVETAGTALTRLRLKAGSTLSSLIEKELADLGIRKGKFEVSLSSLKSTNKNQCKLEEVSATGFDRIEFLFSSGPGEEPKPLRKIASGGEMSRIMLALKRQLAMADSTPVLVFDEIDANIGGRMGKIIGEKLKLVSQSHQVICITHLPQIASYADRHMKVTKSIKNNRTLIEIEKLSLKTRTEEIAEMIRGDEKSDVTREQAKEMLEDARKFQKT